MNVAYQTTTVPIENQPQHNWDKVHLILKVCQLIFSIVAFACEEAITQCVNCNGLYFFEFVSCSAFLICILMLVVYLTPLKEKINIPSFKKVDFIITACTGGLFLIASIVFIATIDTSALANTSVAFGFLATLAFLAELYFMWKNNYLKNQEKPKAAAAQSANGGAEGQPLNSPVQENQA